MLPVEIRKLEEEGEETQQEELRGVGGEAGLMGREGGRCEMTRLPQMDEATSENLT